jgi:hypothetical protein
MMKRIFICGVAVLALAAVAAAQDRQDPKDLAECVEQIRARGMSEVAYSHLGTVAGMRVGGSSWAFKKDETSGAYWTSYTSNRCRLPNEDPAEAERERMQFQYKLDTEVSRLRPLADADGSGFVSTAEGLAFRKLCEFGYKAAFVASEEQGDMERILAGLQIDLGGTDPEALAAKLKEYEELRQRAAQGGVADLPEVALDE